MTPAVPDLVDDPAAQRNVFMVAQRHYLAWLKLDAPTVLSEPVDRKLFNRLQSAAHEMQDALRQLGRGANLSLLLALMQQAEGARQPQAAYFEQLDALPEVLGLLSLAAAQAGGRGGQADMSKRAWVWCAAWRWRLQLGDEPSGAERGRFWNAIDEFQSGADRCAEVPEVTRSVVVEGLKLFRQAGPGADESADIQRL